MFKRKYSLTFIDERWDVMKTQQLFVIPRLNELVYLDTDKKYYQVINVIHYLNKKHGIFIVLAPFENNLK